MSDLLENVYLFPRAGSTPENTALLTSIVGPSSIWGVYQHGVQLLSNNHLLLFANREGQDQMPSTVIEYDLDDGTEVWRYEGNWYSANYGGAQRLPGDNTLVTYSNAGVIHETTPDKKGAGDHRPPVPGIRHLAPVPLRGPGRRRAVEAQDQQAYQSTCYGALGRLRRLA